MFGTSFSDFSTNLSQSFHRNNRQDPSGQESKSIELSNIPSAPQHSSTPRILEISARARGRKKRKVKEESKSDKPDNPVPVTQPVVPIPVPVPILVPVTQPVARPRTIFPARVDIENQDSSESNSDEETLTY